MRILLLAGVAALAACDSSSPAPPDAQAISAANGDDDKAPLGALVDPASPGSATETASRYADAVTSGRLEEAYRLLAPGSEAAGADAAAFAAHFKGLRKVAMTVGKAGDPVDAEQKKLVEVPAILTGIDEAGTPFRVEGPMLLRVADQSARPDVPPHWQVVRTLFPAAPEQPQGRGG